MNQIFLDRVARRILSCHERDLPDLRRATVLLPNCHIAKPLAQAMGSAANLPVLLLPQMVTLSDWAQSVPLNTFIQSDTQRIATLYQALRERRWFVDADLWSLSRELLGLMDDLTRHHVALPESEAEFARQLALAYQARSGQAMQFEARVVHELWHAMLSGTELDGVRAWQQRLARLAQQVDTPLYVLLTADLPAPEVRFLDACRARVPVTVFDLREMAADAPDCALLVRTLQCGAGSTDMRSDAAWLKMHPDAALGKNLKLFAAHGLEQEAQAADVQIRRWLLENKKSIAVVVQDRLVARRVRALLERAQVLVQDETGWTFATLSVSTVLMRWLEAVQNDFYYQDVLDLFKSPFLFADAPSAERKYAAYLFEQMVRKHGAAAHLENFLDLAQRESHDLIQPLVRLRQAAQALPRRNVTLAEWLHALHDSLDILGVLQGWAQDAAGQQLLQLLAQWTDELSEDSTRCNFAEWRRWLSQQLDLNTFRDTAVESPVLFTHLAATRWRNFDAVLLLGCDAGHLPAPANAGQWFNDAVRAALGLPLSSTQQAQVRDDLLALLAINDSVLVTWQASKNGEPNLLSPHFEMMRALHLLAYGDNLAEHELGVLLENAKVVPPSRENLAEAGERGMPAPAVPADLIPQRISPSGYNSLIACPYQFHARHILRLNELDEVREGVEKRDYGEWVHDILHRFHQQFPVLAGHARAMLEEALQRLSNEVFAPAVERDYLARAWLMRWQQAIPAYLDAQSESETEGWHYQNGEVPFELPLDGKLLMHGRIDRVDVHAVGAVRVLDYKLMEVARLRSKLKEPGEDVQLACYAHVYEAGEAAFVSIEKDKVMSVAPPQDLPELAQANIERLQAIFGQIRAGAAMPANGVDEACVYCEMRGLCRKSEWSQRSDD